MLCWSITDVELRLGAIDSASAEEVPMRYRRWLVEYHRQGRDPGE